MSEITVLLIAYCVVAICILVYLLATDIETASKGQVPSIGMSFLIAAIWPLVLLALVVWAWRNAR